jgi:hypothetical protein
VCERLYDLRFTLPWRGRVDRRVRTGRMGDRIDREDG